MAPPPHRPRALQWQVFRGSDAVRRGMLSWSQLRGAAWIHVGHDVYADSRIHRDHALACRAFGLRLPVSAVFAGPSAAHLHGIEHAGGFDDPVHVIVPGRLQLRSRPALRIHSIDLEPDEWAALNGLRRTTPLRTAWDVACWSELTQAVAILDSMLESGLVGPEDLAHLADRHEGSANRGRALRVFELTDPRSRSYGESQLRIRLVTAGLPRPAARHPVELKSGRVLHPEVVWPDYRVAVELDGPRPGQAEEEADVDPDILRRYQRGQLIAAGWTMLQVTTEQVGRDFTAFVSDIRMALLGRGWQP